jgi:hypothetical protein
VAGRPDGPENLGGDEGQESSGFGRQTTGGRSVEYRAGARLWSQAGKRVARFLGCLVQDETVASQFRPQ